MWGWQWRNSTMKQGCVESSTFVLLPERVSEGSARAGMAHRVHIVHIWEMLCQPLSLWAFPVCLCLTFFFSISSQWFIISQHAHDCAYWYRSKANIPMSHLKWHNALLSLCFVVFIGCLILIVSRLSHFYFSSSATHTHTHSHTVGCYSWSSLASIYRNRCLRCVCRGEEVHHSSSEALSDSIMTHVVRERGFTVGGTDLLTF